jgi:hypothetical protein
MAADGMALWQRVAEAARERGIDPAELERRIVLPLSRGGAGWPWWRPELTSEELATWLLRQVARTDGPDERKESVMSGELVLADQDRDRAFLPVMSLDAALARSRQVTEFVQKILRPGTDFGNVPGTDKPTLLKPGAEKLCTFFGLRKVPEVIEKVQDWTGAEHGGEPFFYYIYRYNLYHGDVLVASGDGSCNSWEKKYRYRNADRACPQCGAAAIKRSKYPPREDPHAQPGWYCYGKAGGCGGNFAADDPSIAQQKAGRVPNPDVADVVNTVLKMAQKRALVAATLLAVNASDFFTQDVEDQVDEHEAPQEPAPARPAKPTASVKAPARPANGNGQKSKAPETGPELQQWLEARDKWLQAEGLAHAGELLAAVRRAMQANKLGESVAALDKSLFHHVSTAVKAFEDEARARNLEPAAEGAA